MTYDFIALQNSSYPIFCLPVSHQYCV